MVPNLIVKYNSNGSWSVSGGSGAAVDDYPMALAGAVLIASPYAGRIEHWSLSTRDFNRMFDGYGGDISLSGY